MRSKCCHKSLDIYIALENGGVGLGQELGENVKYFGPYVTGYLPRSFEGAEMTICDCIVGGEPRFWSVAGRSVRGR